MVRADEGREASSYMYYYSEAPFECPGSVVNGPFKYNLCSYILIYMYVNNFPASSPSSDLFMHVSVSKCEKLFTGPLDTFIMQSHLNAHSELSHV